MSITERLILFRRIYYMDVYSMLRRQAISHVGRRWITIIKKTAVCINIIIVHGRARARSRGTFTRVILRYYIVKYMRRLIHDTSYVARVILLKITRYKKLQIYTLLWRISPYGYTACVYNIIIMVLRIYVCIITVVIIMIICKTRQTCILNVII